MAVARIEILVRVASKVAESLNLVLHGVRMNDVHDHSYPQTVSLIHQFLELFGSSESRTERKEIGNLIPERSIVRVFLQSHDLDDIVAQGSYPRKHVLAELGESGHLLLLRRHPDMAFVDQGICNPGGTWILP